jgi:hypothetical protein
VADRDHGGGARGDGEVTREGEVAQRVGAAEPQEVDDTIAGVAEGDVEPLGGGAGVDAGGSVGAVGGAEGGPGGVEVAPVGAGGVVAEPVEVGAEVGGGLGEDRLGDHLLKGAAGLIAGQGLEDVADLEGPGVGLVDASEQRDAGIGVVADLAGVLGDRAQQQVLDDVEAGALAEAEAEAEPLGEPGALVAVAEDVVARAAGAAEPGVVAQKGLAIGDEVGVAAAGRAAVADVGVIAEVLGVSREQVGEEAATARDGVAVGLDGAGEPGAMDAGIVAQELVDAQAGVVDRLGEVGAKGGLFGGEELVGAGELGEVVGEELIEEVEIGGELAGLGSTFDGGAVGQAEGADAVGGGELVEDRPVVGELAVATAGGRLAVGGVAAAMRVGGEATGGEAGLQLGGVDPHRQAGAQEAELGAGGEGGDLTGGDLEQPALARGGGGGGEGERTDGPDGGHVHDGVDQIGGADGGAQRRQLAEHEAVVEVGAGVELVLAAALVGGVAAAGEADRRGEVGLDLLDDLGQDVGGLIDRADLDLGLDPHLVGGEQGELVVLTEAAAAVEAGGGAGERLLGGEAIAGLEEDVVEAGELDGPRGGVAGVALEVELVAALEVIERRLGGAEGLDPGVGDAFEVEELAAQVSLGDRGAGEDLRGARQGDRGVAAGDEVGDGVVDAIAEVGDRITQLLEDGDPGVVGVEVGPLGAGEAL